MPDTATAPRRGRPRVRAVIDRDERIYRLIAKQPRKLTDIMSLTGHPYNEVYLSVRRLYLAKRIDRVVNTMPRARSRKVNRWTVVDG